MLYRDSEGDRSRMKQRHGRQRGNDRPERPDAEPSAFQAPVWGAPNFPAALALAHRTSNQYPELEFLVTTRGKFVIVGTKADLTKMYNTHVNVETPYAVLKFGQVIGGTAFSQMEGLQDAVQD